MHTEQDPECYPTEWVEYDPTYEPIGTVFRDIVHGEPPF
jgi:hypothetical protein